MKKIILLFVLLSRQLAFGQTDLKFTSTSDLPFIEVTGTATQEIVPDKIFISITLINKIIDKQQYTIQTQEEKLKKMLTQNGIDLNRLSLNTINSEILTYKRKDVGFEVKKTFTLLLNTAEQVSTVAKELQNLNIKEASVIKLDHTKIDSLRKEVRIAAIKAAKSKAEYLLKSVDEEIGQALEIKEVTNDGYNYGYQENRTLNFLSNSTNGTMSSNNSDEENSDYDKIRIVFSYFVKYSIKQSKR